MTEAEAREAVAKHVSRETLDRLDTYRELLLKWQKTVNLVSPASTDEIWSRHFLDSLQLVRALDDIPLRWADLGSGGGFPGLVCAIALAERGETQFHLVESDTRKCAFLRQVLQETSISVSVENARAETLPPIRADIVSARALAPLPRLLPLVHRHVAPQGIALLQKGARHAEELELARVDWQMEVDIVTSVTATDAVILRLRNLAHA
ncbi:MAG: 16S rRNA (guanine(527)-N(7))-methyltransferase RsmG [Roseicyclus sp.]